ncbi:hypothetical protein cyc_05866 [Cyclospora cayetanensis]|uniref:Uncharacterized protein n=1 Tax=Cyclospora cayetanensis TaxID=88456 RepID=A0A1D3DAI5_9EIME|nr:hypothetical protein cyc_05866 [Cyclospora cayetanensis]
MCPLPPVPLGTADGAMPANAATCRPAFAAEEAPKRLVVAPQGAAEAALKGVVVLVERAWLLYQRDLRGPSTGWNSGGSPASSQLTKRGPTHTGTTVASWGPPGPPAEPFLVACAMPICDSYCNFRSAVPIESQAVKGPQGGKDQTVRGLTILVCLGLVLLFAGIPGSVALQPRQVPHRLSAAAASSGTCNSRSRRCDVSGPLQLASRNTTGRIRRELQAERPLQACVPSFACRYPLLRRPPGGLLWASLEDSTAERTALPRRATAAPADGNTRVSGNASNTLPKGDSEERSQPLHGICVCVSPLLSNPEAPDRRPRFLRGPAAYESTAVARLKATGASVSVRPPEAPRGSRSAAPLHLEVSALPPIPLRDPAAEHEAPVGGLTRSSSTSTTDSVAPRSGNADNRQGLLQQHTMAFAPSRGSISCKASLLRRAFEALRGPDPKDLHTLRFYQEDAKKREREQPQQSVPAARLALLTVGDGGDFSEAASAAPASAWGHQHLLESLKQQQQSWSFQESSSVALQADVLERATIGGALLQCCEAAGLLLRIGEGAFEAASSCLAGPTVKHKLLLGTRGRRDGEKHRQKAAPLGTHTGDLQFICVLTSALAEEMDRGDSMQQKWSQKFSSTRSIMQALRTRITKQTFKLLCMDLRIAGGTILRDPTKAVLLRQARAAVRAFRLQMESHFKEADILLYVRGVPPRDSAEPICSKSTVARCSGSRRSTAMTPSKEDLPPGSENVRSSPTTIRSESLDTRPRRASCSLYEQLIAASTAAGLPCFIFEDGWMLLGVPGSDELVLKTAAARTTQE